MSQWGIGASVARKEDERFLTGRGQYVADFRIPGMREVAFVRSPVAHARIRAVHVPDAHKAAVFAAGDMTGVKPIEYIPVGRSPHGIYFKSHARRDQ